MSESKVESEEQTFEIPSEVWVIIDKRDGLPLDRSGDIYTWFTREDATNAVPRIGDADFLEPIQIGVSPARLEAAEARIAELEANKDAASPWCPDECPITGLQFFMWIEHPDRGFVPTYGGPFDSYTLAERIEDGDGDWSFGHERYCHDSGEWRDYSSLDFILIEERDIHKAEEKAEKLSASREVRIAELEAEIARRDAEANRPIGVGDVVQYIAAAWRTVGIVRAIESDRVTLTEGCWKVEEPIHNLVRVGRADRMPDGSPVPQPAGDR